MFRIFSFLALIYFFACSFFVSRVVDVFCEVCRMFFLLLAFGECWLSYLFAARVSEIPPDYIEIREIYYRENENERTYISPAEAVMAVVLLVWRRQTFFTIRLVAFDKISS